MSMKKVILSAIVTIIIFSCKKESTSSEQRSYSDIYGMYNSQSGDTVTVGRGNTETTIWMRYAAKNTYALRAIFDSVKINPDYTFTANEHSTRNDQFNSAITVVGAGFFATDIINFDFSIDGTRLIFIGVKKQ